MSPSQRSWAQFGAWSFLIGSLAVALWGAFVRASGAGDACGGGWPLCQGQAVPFGASLEAWLAWSHRISSALLAVGSIVLAALVWRGGRTARACAAICIASILAQTVVGAGVALGPWGDAGRLAFGVAHVAGTFVALAAAAMLVGRLDQGWRLDLANQAGIATLVGVSLAGVLVTACSGSLAALGGETLVGLGGPELLDRWRLVNPWLAVAMGVLVSVGTALIAQRRSSHAVESLAMVAQGLIATQLGLTLIVSLVPAQGWTHLAGFALAQALWIAVVAQAHAALSIPAPPRSTQEPAVRATLRELPPIYVQLTKPRVISLLLFTTVTAAFVAARGWPGGWVMLAIVLGGYGMAGAANAINMVVDRDIDARMERTAKRPTVDGRVSGRHAIGFAITLAVASFAVLAWGANLLAATLSLAGLSFYVVVYTLLLKRRTWHNIVLGGAAGSFPPLVGYAAVAGDVGPIAWTLFAIIFFWTPVHFWALALMIRDEYAGVGVPMLPVVRGERATVVQIVAYAVLTAALSVLPLFQREVSGIYVALAILLNVALLARVASLVRVPDRPRAVSLFKFSMLYLAILFLGVAIDRSLL